MGGVQALRSLGGCAGEDVMQEAGGPTYTFRRFCWLWGEETGGGSRCRVLMRQDLDCTGWCQQDGERGGFKSSTVSLHGSFSCVTKRMMGGAATTLLLQLGESPTLWRNGELTL